MAAYNGERFIATQISSILEQLGPEDELIISDDQSRDNTVAIIKSFKDTRIKLFIHSSKAGPVENFENALNQASGDIIFLSDQDDIWLPGKVSAQIFWLNNYDLVTSDAAVVDEKGSLLYPSFHNINKSGNGFIRNWINNGFMGCCMAFNKKVLNYVLPFPKKIAMHDSWIGLNVSLVGKCYFLDKPLIHYRRHSNNTMPSFAKNHLPLRYQISYRLYMLFHVLKRRFSNQYQKYWV